MSFQNICLLLSISISALKPSTQELNTKLRSQNTYTDIHRWSDKNFLRPLVMREQRLTSVRLSADLIVN